MEHGRDGVQPDVDPTRESERLAAVWRALDAFARRAFAADRSDPIPRGGGSRQAGGTVAG